MTTKAAAAYPELRRAFEGYLHEDFIEEHGTAARALDAFVSDANAGERRRLAAEITRFLAKTSRLDLEAASALLADLGAAWAPPSVEVLRATLDAAARRARGRGSMRRRPPSRGSD